MIFGPNITGGFGSLGNKNGDSYGFSNGAFGQSKANELGSLLAGTNQAVCDYYINASFSSAIYGGSDTVQPKANQALIIIKD